MNDAYGHEAGGHLIQKAAGLFAGVCGYEGICRLGCDEFLGAVTSTSKDDMEALLRRIRDAFVS